MKDLKAYKDGAAFEIPTAEAAEKARIEAKHKAEAAAAAKEREERLKLMIQNNGGLPPPQGGAIRN